MLFLVLLTFILHIYRLDILPPGVDNDETVKAVDAYSLLITGKDQWAKLLPLNFKGFGSYATELYTYAMVPAIALFDLSPMGIRIPATIVAFSSVIGTYFLGKKLFGKKAGLISSFFLSLSPWYLGMTRIGIEAPLGTMFMIYGTLFFLASLKRNRWFIISIIYFLLSIYTYHAYRITVPIFIIGLSVFYWNRIKTMKRDVFAGVFIFMILLIPLGITVLLGSGGVRYSQIILTKDIGTVNNINETRTTCEEILLPFSCKLVHNRPVEFISLYFKNYLSHFSPQNLFITGFQSTLAVTPPGGLFLQIELFLFFIGIYYLIKNRNKNGIIIFIWMALSPVADSFTGSEHYHRFFIIFPTYQIISGYAVSVLPRKIIINSLVLIGAVLCIFIFFTRYFGSYPIIYSQRSHYEYKPLFSKLLAMESNYPAIYISRAEFDTKQYVFYLYYSHTHPQKFQSKQDIELVDGSDGWVSVKRIGKWYFVDILPDSMTIPENSLVVGAGQEFKNHGVFPLAKTYMLDGKEAFYIFRSCTHQERARINEATFSGELIQPECYY